jgi:hypothetical protein
MNPKHFLKPITYALVFILMSISNYVFGKNKPETIEIKPGAFTSVIFDGAYEVELIQGKEESLTVIADEEDIDELKAEIEQGKLRIHTKSSLELSKFIIILKFKTLEMVEFNGGLKLKSKQDLKFSNMKIKINGGADIALKLTAESLDLELSGGTNGEIKGTVNKLDLVLNGAGRIVTDELTAKDVKVQINGAGYATVFASNSIDATIAGVGSIEYTGKPAKVKSNIMGLGAIKEKDK